MYLGKPVLSFQATRDAVTLRADSVSTRGELKLVIHGVGKYTITSLKITLTDYFIDPLVPTTFALEPLETFPLTLVLPLNWTISVGGPFSSGQTLTADLRGVWWASDIVPIPLTLTATTRILWAQ